MKANKSTTVELSWLRLSRLSYLRESHPDKAEEPIPEVQENPVQQGVQTILNFNFSEPVPPPVRVPETLPMYLLHLLFFFL